MVSMTWTAWKDDLAPRDTRVVGRGGRIVCRPEDLVIVLAERFDPRTDVSRVLRRIVRNPAFGSDKHAC